MKNGKGMTKEMMEYTEAIDFLFNSLPVYQREGGTAFKPGLDNTIKLLKALGNPQSKFKTIHVAGTNGKGSVSHMLCSVLMKAGYKTGLYTSPHLLDFRERIRIDGKKIKKKYVIDFVNKIQGLCSEIKPSFFEITVAMSFAYFAKKKVEVAIVETGMGGRLDSTNVVTPLLSVITNIGRDHTHYLGNTLAEIAGEKAGIIKNNVPAVIGQSHDETVPVFESAALEKGASIVFADQVYNVKYRKTESHGLTTYKVKRYDEIVNEALETDLGGVYQVKNIATLLMSLEELNKHGLEIKKKSISDGLKKVKKKTGLMGRWDIKQSHPLVVFDTAHNVEGLIEIKKQLRNTDYKKLYIVFGMVNDKVVDDIIEALPLKAFYFFTKANMPRSMEINELYKAATFRSLRGVTCASVKIAYSFAMDMAKKDDLVLVMGSNFLIAEAMEKINFNDKVV